MTMLHETMRPRTWDAVVGQPKAVAMLKRIEANGGFGGKALWVSGPSGSGKTSLAKIAAGTLADDWCVTEFDAADSLSVGDVREIGNTMRLMGMGTKGGRAYIVNEAHGLRGAVIRELLGVLERIPHHVMFAFTTTKAGEELLFDGQADASPLLSRCIAVPLTNQGLAKAFAPMLAEKARALGLDGQPEAAYVRLMQDCRNNVREAWGQIESGRMLAG